MKILRIALVLLIAQAAIYAQDPTAEIQSKTKKFTEAIVSKDLSILDQVFEKDPTDIYYDINEGPLVGFDRLKRVWTAATTNYTISKFEFGDDMKILIDGNNAVQTGTWTQTQVNKGGQSRDIHGRATILWRKRDGQWRVWHYHASITPLRQQQRPGNQ
ncbi:MAG TPA: nuclear transport factor 2 family protein [Blastocatellia bacterium]|nr:nuclear transport factor 2 family protein [Blastocatellia bacterium]